MKVSYRNGSERYVVDSEYTTRGENEILADDLRNPAVTQRLSVVKVYPVVEFKVSRPRTVAPVSTKRKQILETS